MALRPLLSEEDLKQLSPGAQAKWNLMREAMDLVCPKCSSPELACSIFAMAIGNILGKTWQESNIKLRGFVVDHLAYEIILQTAKLTLALSAQKDAKTATKN